MNNIEKQKINELLKDRKELICDNLYLRDYNEVIEILEMPEWEDEKYKSLLTANIWKRNAKEVKEILEMPEWEEKNIKVY